MTFSERTPSRRGEDAVSPWAVAVAIVAGAVLAGIAYLVTRPKPLTITTRAHASDGKQLATSCACSQEGCQVSCCVNVRNTASAEIVSQAGLQSADGSAFSNEVSTSVPVAAREVCLHIWVTEGDFSSAPEFGSGDTAPHVRTERELIIFLGDMQPYDEANVSVRVRPSTAP